jgi:hypothetical protein
MRCYFCRKLILLNKFFIAWKAGRSGYQKFLQIVKTVESGGRTAKQGMAKKGPYPWQ